MYSLNKYGIFSLSSCLAEETQAGDVAAAVRRRRAPQKDAALGEGGERSGGGLSGRGLAAETRRERLANQEPTAGTRLHIQRMTRAQSGWSRVDWSKAEGDAVRGIGRPFRPWRGSYFCPELGGELVQPSTQSEILELHFQRLSRVPCGGSYLVL